MVPKSRSGLEKKTGVPKREGEDPGNGENTGNQELLHNSDSYDLLSGPPGQQRPPCWEEKSGPSERNTGAGGKQGSEIIKQVKSSDFTGP